MARYRLYICHGPNCVRHNLGPMRAALEAELANLEADACDVVISGCQGRCEYGPNINIHPRLTKYCQVTPELARRIVREHIAKGQPVAECMYCKNR